MCSWSTMRRPTGRGVWWRSSGSATRKNPPAAADATEPTPITVARAAIWTECRKSNDGGLTYSGNRANLEGVPFWLVDTAGLREAADPAERIGVARSRAALETADLVLLVLKDREFKGKITRTSWSLSAKERTLRAEVSVSRDGYDPLPYKTTYEVLPIP